MCECDFKLVDRSTVAAYARRLALHDLALTLVQGEDIDGLAWNPEHSTALTRHVGSSVSALHDEVGTDTWAELISAAQDAYDQWMRLHAKESRGLRAERSAYGWSVVDPKGGRWWPSDEAQKYIAAAKNPAYVALRGCIGGELRGEWRS